MSDLTKVPTTTTHDLEHGSIDAITPSGSLSFTPEEPRSKVGTPTRRRSLCIDDTLPGHHTQHTFHTPQMYVRVQQKLPASVARVSQKIIDWVKGPLPLTKHVIKPLFEKVQTFPVRMLRRLPSWARAGLYGGGCILWVVLFAVVLTQNSLPNDIAGYGAPTELSCVANLWYVLEQS